MVLYVGEIKNKNHYLIASLICFIAVGILASLVSPKSIFNSDYVSTADYALFLKIVNSHNQYFNQIMIYLTTYGREVFWILAIIFLFIFGKKEGRRTAAFIALVIVILIPLGIVSKQIIERPRPLIPESDFLIASDSQYSFPSGHALTVSAGATISLLLFNTSSKQLYISLLLVSEAGLVCFSRIYVGGHYPLDIIAGILLGVGISFIVIGYENKLNRLIFLLYRSVERLGKK